MATKDKTAGLKLNVGKVHNVYLPGLKTLYKIQGASLLLKLKIKQLCEEIEAKQFVALASVRQADELRKVAITDTEKAQSETTFQSQLKLATDTEIEIKASKIPFSLLPSEEILGRSYSEQIALENGQIGYVQGDYTTIVADLYGILIEEDEKVNEKLKG